MYTVTLTSKKEYNVYIKNIEVITVLESKKEYTIVLKSEQT